MEIQSTLNSQSNLEKEKMELQESGSLTSNYRRKKKKSYSCQTSMALAQKQKYWPFLRLWVKGDQEQRLKIKTNSWEIPDSSLAVVINKLQNWL